MRIIFDSSAHVATSNRYAFDRHRAVIMLTLSILTTALSVGCVVPEKPTATKFVLSKTSADYLAEQQTIETIDERSERQRLRREEMLKRQQVNSERFAKSWSEEFSKKQISKNSVRNGTNLIVKANLEKLYKFRDVPLYFPSLNYLLSVFVEHESEQVRSAHGFYEINGKAERLEIAFNDDVLQLAVDDPFQTYAVIEAGIIDLKLTLIDLAERISIEVENLPFDYGASAVDLIELLGFPDQRATYYSVWPCGNSANRDRISATASLGAISVEHWLYNEFPRAVFAITSDDKVRRVINQPFLHDLKGKELIPIHTLEGDDSAC